MRSLIEEIFFVRFCIDKGKKKNTVGTGERRMNSFTIHAIRARLLYHAIYCMVRYIRV